MPSSAEQLIETSKANQGALLDVTSHAFAGFEKLITLNLATCKTGMVDSFNLALAIMDIKDAQQLYSLQLGQFQPLVLKYVSYSSHLYNIAAETGTEIIKTCNDVTENVTRSVLPGAETVAVALRSAASASQAAIETAQGAAKKTLELAESQLAAVSHHADNGTTTASRKHS